MMRVVLADNSGTIAGIFFDVPPQVSDALAVGSGAEVTGKVGEFKDQLQINLESIVPIMLTAWLITSPAQNGRNPRWLAELDSLLADIQNPTPEPPAQLGVGRYCTTAKVYAAPASKVNHHACMGGLIEHTLERYPAGGDGM